MSILRKFYANLVSILGQNAITKSLLKSIFLNMGLTPPRPILTMLKKLQIWKRGPSLTTLSSLWITIVDVEENKYRIFCGLIQTCLMLVIAMICYWFLKGEVDTWANYGSPQWEVKLPLTVDQSPSHYFHHDNVFFFKGDWMFGVGLDICSTIPYKGDAGHFH